MITWAIKLSKTKFIYSKEQTMDCLGYGILYCECFKQLHIHRHKTIIVCFLYNFIHQENKPDDILNNEMFRQLIWTIILGFQPTRLRSVFSYNGKNTHRHFLPIDNNPLSVHIDPTVNESFVLLGVGRRAMKN